MRHHYQDMPPNSIIGNTSGIPQTDALSQEKSSSEETLSPKEKTFPWIPHISSRSLVLLHASSSSSSFFTPHRKPSTPQGEGEFDRKAAQESSSEEIIIQRKKLSPGHPIFLHAPLSSSFTLLLLHSSSQNPPHHEGKEELDRKAAARKN
ncbi:unnamed protein product [Sphagnum balticum]